MTTIWGHLERIAKNLPEERWVQVRTVVPGNVAIRVRVSVDENTHIARGIEPVALSNLQEGEFVEVFFRSACTGLVKADTIYVRPEPALNESQCPTSVPPQMNSLSSMHQTHPDGINLLLLRPTVYGHADILGDAFLTLLEQVPRQEPLWRRTSDFLRMRATKESSP